VQSGQDGEALVARIDEPQSVPEASIDDKGRLKVPVEFSKYLAAFGGKRLYITSLDKRLGRIYPEPVWQGNMEVLRTASNRQRAESIQFTAKAHGDWAEIDEAGRALLPANLRKALGISGKTQVWLDAFASSPNRFTRNGCGITTRI
jgi:DNA-binding transcriptional regulator/RsmH inhibitor MraZ